MKLRTSPRPLRARHATTLSCVLVAVLVAVCASLPVLGYQRMQEENVSGSAVCTRRAVLTGPPKPSLPDTIPTILEETLRTSSHLSLAGVKPCSIAEKNGLAHSCGAAGADCMKMTSLPPSVVKVCVSKSDVWVVSSPELLQFALPRGSGPLDCELTSSVFSKLQFCRLRCHQFMPSLLHTCLRVVSEMPSDLAV